MTTEKTTTIIHLYVEETLSNDKKQNEEIGLLPGTKDINKDDKTVTTIHKYERKCFFPKASTRRSERS